MVTPLSGCGAGGKEIHVWPSDVSLEEAKQAFRRLKSQIQKYASERRAIGLTLPVPAEDDCQKCGVGERSWPSLFCEECMMDPDVAAYDDEMQDQDALGDPVLGI